MDMHERIRDLRKNHLKMSQEVFGEHLGVSRAVIKNIELNCLARPEQKLSLIKLMCREFNVNEEWILHGNEPIYIEPETFSLDHFVHDHGMTSFELYIVKAYFELDPAIRKTIIEHFKCKLSSNATPETEDPTESLPDIPDTPEELDRKETDES